MELLQKKGKQPSQSSNSDLAGQTPKYTTSNSGSASSGSNLRHTVAGESRFNSRQPKQPKQSNGDASVRRTVQPLYRSSNPVGHLVLCLESSMGEWDMAKELVE